MNGKAKANAGNGGASAFKRDFIDRTKEAREAAGYSQEEMATVLGITQGRYKQYEKRTPLPHQFIPAFCIACHVSVTWLFTRRDGSRPFPHPLANPGELQPGELPGFAEPPAKQPRGRAPSRKRPPRRKGLVPCRGDMRA